jgi:uncharacterized integral membrane protein
MRLFLMMLMTIGLVLFAFFNTERVELSFIVGQTEVRLIFLLMTSFVGGALSGLLYQAAIGARRRARKQRIRVAVKRLALERGDAE